MHPLILLSSTRTVSGGGGSYLISDNMEYANEAAALAAGIVLAAMGGAAYLTAAESGALAANGIQTGSASAAGAAGSSAAEAAGEAGQPNVSKENEVTFDDFTKLKAGY